MKDARRALVRLHQLSLYVDNHLHDRYLAPPLAIVVAGLLTLWVPVWQAGVWLALALLAIVTYTLVYLRFKRAAADVQDEQHWVRRIALAHGAHMTIWSSIVVWAYVPGNLNSLMFVMLVHVGLISLTVVMSNPHRQLLLSDLIAAALALLAPPLLDGTLFSLGLMALGGFYLALMLMVGMKIHASTTETLVLRERNRELIHELEQQLETDSLTGLKNRDYFIKTARTELERVARYRQPLALLMVDIDHFKQINDTHGHLAGDEVLKSVTLVLSDMVRANDCLARLGGEEFAVLMPQTGLEQAYTAAERLRAAIAQVRCHLQGAEVRPTVSVGIAVAAEGGETLSSLMRRSDLAMYEAKAQGRNCVVAASTPVTA